MQCYALFQLWGDFTVPWFICDSQGKLSLHEDVWLHRQAAGVVCHTVNEMMAYRCAPRNNLVVMYVSFDNCTTFTQYPWLHQKKGKQLYFHPVHCKLSYHCIPGRKCLPKLAVSLFLGWKDHWMQAYAILSEVATIGLHSSWTTVVIWSNYKLPWWLRIVPTNWHMFAALCLL